MSNILKQHYGPAEGPLGFPLLDKQAFALEAILKALPKDEVYAYRKTLVEPAALDLSPGERSDVSWISTENPDHMNEVVRARGMNDGQFRLNPLATLNHAYWAPPAGKSLWRRVVRDTDLKGVKAKTFYPPRPDQWPDKHWVPDLALALVQADLLRGKSIGFLPTKVHVPEQKEIDQNGWHKVSLVIDEWILLEYACVYLPAQQNAVVEAVGKALPQPPAEILTALGIASESSRVATRGFNAGAREPPDIPFTTLDDIEGMLARHLDALDLPGRAEKMLQAQLNHWRGPPTTCDQDQRKKEPAMTSHCHKPAHRALLLLLPFYFFLFPSGLLAASSQIGGKTSPDGKEEIICDLPGSEQMHNTGGMGPRGPGTGAGLCVFTSIEHAGRFQNEVALIGFQKKMTHEPGGGYPDKVDAMLAKYAPSVVYVQYTGKDLTLLKLAIKTGRMVCVTYGYSPRYGGSIAHMVNLVHLSEKWAAILDNNFPGETSYEWMSPDEFYKRWQSNGGGWAVILLNPPPPPYPHNKPVGQVANLPDPARQVGNLPHKEKEDAMQTALLCLTLLTLGSWGTAPCATVVAPAADTNQRAGSVSDGRDYQWVWAPSDPQRFYLYRNGVQIGGYDAEHGCYLPYNAATDRWGDKTEPPIPPLGGTGVPPVQQAPHRRDAGATVQDFGVDYSQIPQSEECTINGKKCTKDRAKRLIESKDGTLTDDSQKFRLSIFGSETDRADVLAKLPADIKDKLSIQSYPPDHWVVAQRGFRLGPGTTIYVESPDGSVLHRQEGWDGPQSLANAIARADPNYDPSKDPDLRRPKPSPSPTPDSPPAAGCPVWLLHLLNSFLTAVTMVTLYLLTHRRT